MAQRTFCKDIFDFDCPITFCFNLRRSFSHFLLIGFFCSFYLAKSAGFFTLFFCSLWVLFLIQFVFYPFFLDLTASLLPGAATAVCEDVVLCALCCVQVLCAMCKCCVLCAMCFAENYVKVLCAMCRVLFTLWRTMYRCFVLCAMPSNAKYCVNVRSCAWWPQEPSQRHHMLDGSPSI